MLFSKARSVSKSGPSAADEADKAAKPDTGSHGSVIDKLMNAFSEKDDDMVNSFAANAVYVPK